LNNSAICSSNNYKNNYWNKRGRQNNWDNNKDSGHRDNRDKKNYSNSDNSRDSERSRDNSQDKDKLQQTDIQKTDIQKIVNQVMKSVLDKKNNDRIFGNLTKEQITIEEIENKLKEIADNQNKEIKVFNNIKPVTDNSTQKLDNNIANNNAKLAIYNEIETFLPDSVKKKLYNLKQDQKNSEEYNNFVNALSDELKKIIEYGIEIYKDNKKLKDTLQKQIFDYFDANREFYTNFCNSQKKLIPQCITNPCITKYYKDYINTIEKTNSNVAFCILEFINKTKQTVSYYLFSDDYNALQDKITETQSSQYENENLPNDKKYLDTLLFNSVHHNKYQSTYQTQSYNSIMNKTNFDEFYKLYYKQFTIHKISGVKYQNIIGNKFGSFNSDSFHDFCKDKEYNILVKILKGKQNLYIHLLDNNIINSNDNVDLNIHLFTYKGMCPACWTVWHKYVNEQLKDGQFFQNVHIQKFNVYAAESYNPKSHILSWYIPQHNNNISKQNKISMNQYNAYAIREYAKYYSRNPDMENYKQTQPIQQYLDKKNTQFKYKSL
jgi:hypothetical protein